MTYGDTQINCEIGRCKGYNGGAIKNIKGTLKYMEIQKYMIVYL